MNTVKFIETMGNRAFSLVVVWESKLEVKDEMHACVEYCYCVNYMHYIREGEVNLTLGKREVI